MSTTIPVLADAPEMSSLALQAFCNDVARQVHTPSEIAERYGFANARAAAAWIKARPPVQRAIKELRAIWESEENLEGRIRAYYAHAVLEAAPENARIMLDPTVHPSVRIDGLKEMSKVAGLVGAPGGGLVRDKNGNLVSTGGAAPFAVNIIFQSTGQVESITTVAPPPPPETAPDRLVIEGEPL